MYGRKDISWRIYDCSLCAVQERSRAALTVTKRAQRAVDIQVFKDVHYIKY